MPRPAPIDRAWPPSPTHWLTTLALLLLLVPGCTRPPQLLLEDAADLDAWGMVEVLADGRPGPAPAVLEYTVRAPLFTDYASKMRTVWLPPDQQITVRDGELDFPVGTVFTKSFYYIDGDLRAANDESRRRVLVAPAGPAVGRSHYLVETRVLARRNSGWVGLPYVWRDEHAALKVAGTSRALRLLGASAGSPARSPAVDAVAFSYQVPNKNQCAGCHESALSQPGLRPLGARAAQWTEPTLAVRLEARGWLSPAAAELLAVERQRRAMVDYRNQTLDLTKRARSYLDVHCAHCHNPDGAADTSGLYLQVSGGVEPARDELFHLGVCKPPVAAGRAAGEFRYGIAPGVPAESMLLARLASTDPGVMMPELGRSLVDEAGVQLVADWIGSLADRRCAGGRVP